MKQKITYEMFKKVFSDDTGGEYELYFTSSKNKYVITKYKDHVTLFKEFSDKDEKEFSFPDLDTLFETAEIEGFKVKDEWDNISEIVVNNTFEFDEFCEERNIKFDDEDNVE